MVRPSAALRGGAVTAAMKGTTAAGMAAPGVTAAMVLAVVTVGVATPTTAAEETVEAVAREPVRLSDEAAGTVAAALGEAAVVDETAHGVVPLVKAQPSARLPFQVRTTETSRWRQNTTKQLLPWWMLHLRQRA